MGQLAFYFDSSSCSGCKACQMACKDRHGLEVGRLWRRVYEISGGEWAADGPAWTPQIAAYYLSIACNHCERPVCREVCPSGAIAKREDGIVLIDEGLCLGCGYCSWACPYGAPQLNPHTGRMTKCNFCAGEIDSGQPPACVAACPMRALKYGERADLERQYGDQHAVYPLPDPALTRPSLVLKAHRDSARARSLAARIANWEEV